MLTEREETGSIATATNQPFSGWEPHLHRPPALRSTIDRLTVAGRIVETGSTFPRLAHGTLSARAELGAGRVAVVDTIGRRPEQVADVVEQWIVAALTDEHLVMHSTGEAQPASAPS